MWFQEYCAFRRSASHLNKAGSRSSARDPVTYSLPVTVPTYGGARLRPFRPCAAPEKNLREQFNLVFDQPNCIPMECQQERGRGSWLNCMHVPRTNTVTSTTTPASNGPVRVRKPSALARTCSADGWILAPIDCRASLRAPVSCEKCGH